MPQTDLFLGTWQLVPELSLYAAGTPPTAGRYEIQGAEAADSLILNVTWRMAGETEDRSTQFGGRSDGARIPLPASAGGPDAFTITRIDARTLDSAALRGDVVIAYARRSVSSDGALMSVVQESQLGAGQRLRNFQVYRRAAV